MTPVKAARRRLENDTGVTPHPERDRGHFEKKAPREMQDNITRRGSEVYERSAHPGARGTHRGTS